MNENCANRDENKYSAEVVYSAKKLTRKQELSYIHGSLDYKLLEKAAPCDITVDNLIVLSVYNPFLKPDPMTGEIRKEYTVTLVIDKDGTIYSTSSEYFTDTARDIISDMEGETEEWQLHCFKKDSKNRSGSFLTCSII